MKMKRYMDMVRRALSRVFSQQMAMLVFFLAVSNFPSAYIATVPMLFDLLTHLSSPDPFLVNVLKSGTYLYALFFLVWSVSAVYQKRYMGNPSFVVEFFVFHLFGQWMTWGAVLGSMKAAHVTYVPVVLFLIAQSMLITFILWCTMRLLKIRRNSVNKGITALLFSVAIGILVWIFVSLVFLYGYGNLDVLLSQYISFGNYLWNAFLINIWFFDFGGFVELYLSTLYAMLVGISLCIITFCCASGGNRTLTFGSEDRRSIH